MKNLSLKLCNDTELIPLLLILAIVSFVIFLLFHFIPNTKEKKTQQTQTFFHQTKHYPKYTKTDWRNILVITICYAIISLWHLGTNTFPTTTWQPSSQTDTQDIIFHFTQSTTFDAIYTIYGEGDNNANPDTYQLGTQGIQIYGSNDHKTWDLLTELEKGSIYQYQITEGSWNYAYIWLRSTNKNNSLTEIAFRNTKNDGFLPIEVDTDITNTKYPATLLIDEQDKIPLTPTYENESYFDEIYHPRNAWEIANGQDMYATVHPLMGTNIMALFIHVFGMSPLVYRLPGAIFGILLIPLFYALTRRLFSKTSCATMSSILLAADFMHLTTSRIATLEPFSVFWILVMFYFMIRYTQLSWYDTSFKKEMFYLGLSGITMGIAIATKWTACYSAVGLAILLFSSFIVQYKDYRKAKQINDAQAKYVRSIFPKRLCLTIALCFVFFIFIPIVIYALSYLPDHVWKNDTWSLANVWKQCIYMYEYHTNLNATHPYSSTWKQWLLDARPIWYYNGYDANGLQHTISCFSNPLMTWTALGTVLFTLLDGIRTRSYASRVICVGYITALAPWIIITRCVFAYHFYPTSFFAILSIVYVFRYVWQDGKIGKYIIVIYFLFYIGLFLAFLPATAGFGTTNAYIKSLEWFSTWYFG